MPRSPIEYKWVLPGADADSGLGVVGPVGDASTRLYTYTHLLLLSLFSSGVELPRALREVPGRCLFHVQQCEYIHPKPRPFAYGDLTLVFCEEFAANAAQPVPVLAIVRNLVVWVASF